MKNTSGGLVSWTGDPLLSEASREAHQTASIPTLSENLKNGVADVAIPFPEDWMTGLRSINPITTMHSWLLPYFYRAKQRWVLYDAVPVELIDPDAQQGPGLTGRELLQALTGDAPRDRPHGSSTPFVSDVQHEMHRVYRVYARPFWVLEGSNGGHQVAFSPEQKEFLIQCGKSDQTPRIGSLPACPFDGRVVQQLQRMNRLVALNNDVGRLRQSGSSAAADVQRALWDREIRETSLAMLEAQLGETVEMMQHYAHRSMTQDLVIDARGKASQASDALAAYVQTGEYIM